MASDRIIIFECEKEDALQETCCLNATVVLVEALQKPSMIQSILQVLIRPPYPFLNGNTYFHQFANITISQVEILPLEIPFLCEYIGSCQRVPYLAPAMIGNTSYMGSHATLTTKVYICTTVTAS